jgi:uncharacterized protein (DUF2141 family)
MLASGVNLGHSAAPKPNVLRVVVSGVTSSLGYVRVDVCRQQDFLTDYCPYKGATPSQTGSTVVAIPDVPPGVYAVQAYQDKNDNKVVDRDLLGIPSESVGFSNNPAIGLHAPSFHTAAFSYAGGESSISLRLRKSVP